MGSIFRDRQSVTGTRAHNVAVFLHVCLCYKEGPAGLASSEIGSVAPEGAAIVFGRPSNWSLLRGFAQSF
eukprot:357988-Chlamydomonas_euryale.AAC.2